MSEREISLETFILEDALGHVLTMRSGTMLNTAGWGHLFCAMSQSSAVA